MNLNTRPAQDSTPPRHRLWLQRIGVGIGWAAGTAVGWVAGTLLMGASVMSSALWDPDEVTTYLNTPLWRTVANGLLMGALMGAILGVGVSVIGWLVRRNVKDALLYLLATTALSAALCAIAGTGGPAQYQSDQMIALRGSILGGGVAGGISGLIQSIILRRHVNRTGMWIWVTIAGYIVGWGIMFGFAGPFTLTDLSLARRLSLLPLPLLCGALVGLGQWVALRHRVERAGWWIPVTAVAWGMAYLPFYFELWGGIALGITSGAALAWLLHPPPLGMPADGDARAR